MKTIQKKSTISNKVVVSAQKTLVKPKQLTKNIVWHPKIFSISQVPKEGMEYALVSANYEQIHQLIWCKDFLQDCLYSYLNKKHIEVYGFKYNPKKDFPVYLQKTRIIVANWQDQEFKSKLLNNCLPFLHQIEEKLKMKKTEIFQCSKVPPLYRKSGIWLIEGSRRWMRSPPMLSMYSLLIRIGMMHNPKNTYRKTIEGISKGKIPPYYDQQSRDKGVLHRAIAGIDEIIKYGDAQIFHRNLKSNYSDEKLKKQGKELCVYTIHDQGGIVAFSEGKTAKIFPDWHNKLNKLRKNKS